MCNSLHTPPHRHQGMIDTINTANTRAHNLDLQHAGMFVSLRRRAGGIRAPAGMHAISAGHATLGEPCGGTAQTSRRRRRGSSMTSLTRRRKVTACAASRQAWSRSGSVQLAITVLTNEDFGRSGYLGPRTMQEATRTRHSGHQRGVGDLLAGRSKSSAESCLTGIHW
jgi:hypothetical protein